MPTQRLDELVSHHKARRHEMSQRELASLEDEIRRLAHHRSRSMNFNYYYQPRVSVSWGGRYVGFASNFNQDGVVDVYVIPFELSSRQADESAVPLKR